VTGTGGDEVPSAAVDRYVALRRRRPAWDMISPGDAPATVEAGYALQAAVHRRLAAEGNPPLGFKIGSTSPKTQRGLGLDEPIYAGIFADTRAADLREGLSRPLRTPSIECEIALVLGRDIDVADLRPSALRDAVASCHLACEIIDNRYGDPLKVGIPTLLADDFFHAAFVVGEANPGWRGLDLSRLAVRVTRDGEVSAGSTADALAAEDALAWLVRALARSGRHLRAGDVVLTGSILAPIAISAMPRTLALEIEGFAPLELPPA
jgi:2-keto-4-pentenoate hydratase